MIELKGVSKSFSGNPAVQQISFQVQEHENLILLGTSGCGKTTTLKMINRLIEPDIGTIFIDGKDITKENPETLRRGIGYVMQNIGLFPHYTIAQNISVVPKLLGWSKKQINIRTHQLIEKLHLPANCLNIYPHELSGGQQQRVGLARALVIDPAVLLMDEPFGALDNVTRASIQAEFKALEELKRKTIVMVTHDVEEAFELADRICLMDKGHIVQISTPKELLYNPINDFVKTFLDGHRLVLEFKTTTLNDIWNLLPLITSEIFISEMQSDSNVWQVLELLRSSGKEEVIVSNTNGEQKAITFQELTKVFNQYQKTQRHE